MTVNKLVFGITGQTGSGKSYISDLFREMGVTVFDADKISREVTFPGTPCLSDLETEFGSGIIAEDGSLIRPALARIVFSDSDKLRILNRISHKYIKKEIEDRLCRCETRAAAIDGAVIIGSEVEQLCRFLVGVIAPEDMRLSRIILRDSLSEEAALARMNAQPDSDYYIKHCKYIIKNDLTENLREKVSYILERELS